MREVEAIAGAAGADVVVVLARVTARSSGRKGERRGILVQSACVRCGVGLGV